MPTVLLALCAALALSFAVEAGEGGRERPVSRRPGDLAIRFASYGLLTLFWFVFSWRPWLAATSCVLTVAGLAIVSRLKRGVIGEPLVFSDFALIPQVPRHPDLYYTKPFGHPAIAGPLLLSVGVVVLWYWLEPTVLPGSPWMALAAILVLPLLLAGFAASLLTPLAAGWIAGQVPRPDPEADVARYGLAASLVLYVLRWRATRRDPPVPLPAANDSDLRPAAEIVVVVQLESFVDPERLGGAPIPALELFRARALQHGRLRVPAHGAYTMRTEHAVLTGRTAEDLGFGVFDPYLSAGGREPGSLAQLANAAGYDTAFVHPFHRNFFDRARVIEEIGFRRLVMEEDFAGAERVGPYVGDAALGRHILAEVRERTGPLFLFAVTMENHGPWKRGRLAGIDEPLDQYLHHVAHTGRMVEDLVAGLEGLDAVLCVYGDHAPALPNCRPGFGGTATDYAVFRFGCSTMPPRRVDLSADALGRALRGALARERDDDASVAVPRS
ncbi:MULTISPECIES: LTA synthase family protein [Methylobacterium]|uniref:Sulfatase N-terminal domain-containing protein n=3 Tax=Pseudomonadota TaxID=1224 RepID=A0ABQ4T1E2_9HYPH|nr:MULTISPECIES: LTA synthase family protein [Methylobacterium]PIU06715.1 MAG: sulfatase [Methylobacterium sp. CG09_land_8_20_14_0_10_71_15]PIU15863.1 MAG: sulfatase [Methylobacterium sp. CG08_land_8_20_14_0_20_71_15]GBU19726.1 capsular polysaccharide biosynthesis protein RkpI [Methylobacterium sp.]GJE08857.1 hypothetical protein AOPFMNJM_4203 [Methylobacterium jeotgali]